MSNSTRTGDFAGLVTDLAYGAVHAQLTDHVREIAAAVEETGLSGKLTLTLAFRREGQVAAVAAKITKTVPQHPLPGTLFFFGVRGSGELHRDHPRQLTLDDALRLPEPEVVRLADRAERK